MNKHLIKLLTLAVITFNLISFRVMTPTIFLTASFITLSSSQVYAEEGGGGEGGDGEGSDGEAEAAEAAATEVEVVEEEAEEEVDSYSFADFMGDVFGFIGAAVVGFVTGGPIGAAMGVATHAVDKATGFKSAIAGTIDSVTSSIGTAITGKKQNFTLAQDVVAGLDKLTNPSMVAAEMTELGTSTPQQDTLNEIDTYTAPALEEAHKRTGLDSILKEVQPDPDTNPYILLVTEGQAKTSYRMKSDLIHFIGKLFSPIVNKAHASDVTSNPETVEKLQKTADQTYSDGLTKQIEEAGGLMPAAALLMLASMGAVMPEKCEDCNKFESIRIFIQASQLFMVQHDYYIMRYYNLDSLVKFEEEKYFDDYQMRSIDKARRYLYLNKGFREQQMYALTEAMNLFLAAGDAAMVESEQLQQIYADTKDKIRNEADKSINSIYSEFGGEVPDKFKDRVTRTKGTAKTEKTAKLGEEKSYEDKTVEEKYQDAIAVNAGTKTVDEVVGKQNASQTEAEKKPLTGKFAEVPGQYQATISPMLEYAKTVAEKEFYYYCKAAPLAVHLKSPRLRAATFYSAAEMVNDYLTEMFEVKYEQIKAHLATIEKYESDIVANSPEYKKNTAETRFSLETELNNLNNDGTLCFSKGKVPTPDKSCACRKTNSCYTFTNVNSYSGGSIASKHRREKVSKQSQALTSVSLNLLNSYAQGKAYAVNSTLFKEQQAATKKLLALKSEKMANDNKLAAKYAAKYPGFNMKASMKMMRKGMNRSLKYVFSKEKDKFVWNQFLMRGVDPDTAKLAKNAKTNQNFIVYAAKMAKIKTKGSEKYASMNYQFSPQNQKRKKKTISKEENQKVEPNSQYFSRDGYYYMLNDEKSVEASGEAYYKGEMRLFEVISERYKKKMKRVKEKAIEF